MPRPARARRRFARAEEQVRQHRDRIVAAATAAERHAAAERLVGLLRRIAASPVPLWPLAKRVFELGGEGNDDTSALICQIVDASLTGATRGPARTPHATARA